MTLSHCWGAAETVKLLQGNVREFCSGFSVDRLPATYKDAIHLTKALGVRYLWIDSLCIIQDSEEDWLREAAAMDTVYASSHCNIAALDAVDSHGGCFLERDPSRVDIDDVEVHHPHGESSRRYRVLTNTDWVEALEQSPLYHRAWVLQERFLPPRTLLYGKHQILWECRSHAACERSPSGVPDLIQPHAVFRAKQMLAKVDLTPSQHFWEDIVERYSRGDLTRLGDKLVALSGIASVYGLADDYLSGLWRETLLPGLLWQVPELKQFNGQPSVRPAGYRAPSWSWASVEGETTYPLGYNYRRIIARVLDAQTTSLLPPTASGEITAEDRAKSKFHQITAGYIRISGIFGEARLTKTKYDRRLFFSMSKINTQSQSADSNQVELLKQKLINVAVLLDEYHHARPPPLEVYWIFISTTSGLVLSRSHRGLYKRLGTFTGRELGTVQLENIPHATITVFCQRDITIDVEEEDPTPDKLCTGSAGQGATIPDDVFICNTAFMSEIMTKELYNLAEDGTRPGPMTTIKDASVQDRLKVKEGDLSAFLGRI
ncbi:MAG: hypothetical protein Q9165_003143 [Trypethelium subeluteriae]